MAETQKKFIDQDGLAVLNEHNKSKFAGKSDVPTKTSELVNDSNFVSDANYVHTDSNFTAAEKTKLAGVAANADVSTITSITVNGVSQVPTGKTVNIAVPTDNSQLANGAGYQTAAEVEAAINGKGFTTSDDVEQAISAKGYQTSSQVESAITSKGYQTAANVKSTVEGYGYQTAAQVNVIVSGKGYQTASEVQALIANAEHLKRSVVDALPTSGIDASTIYLVPADLTGTSNVKDEYMYINGAWEKIGSSEVDLSGYMKTDDMVALTSEEILAILGA